jgi:predicted phosphodiesterase
VPGRGAGPPTGEGDGAAPIRFGLIADIHGNALALDTVLRELEREGIEDIICLGDVAVGPQPIEALERVRELGCPTIMGNWDAYFVNGFPEADNAMASRLIEIGAWWAEQLSAEHLEHMRTFVPTFELELGPIRTLLFHGSPRSHEDFIYATTPDEKLDPMLGGASAPIMVGAHTHFQMVRRRGDGLLINPGSVGLPFAEPAPVMRILPWAEYGVLWIQKPRFGIELRRTLFDVQALVRIILESGMPHAEWWAGLWTPGELPAEVAARFAGRPAASAR